MRDIPPLFLSSVFFSHSGVREPHGTGLSFGPLLNPACLAWGRASSRASLRSRTRLRAWLAQVGYAVTLRMMCLVTCVCETQHAQSDISSGYLQRFQRWSPRLPPRYSIVLFLDLQLSINQTTALTISVALWSKRREPGLGWVRSVRILCLAWSAPFAVCRRQRFPSCY
ncbi:hypothetical protein B0T24DRAFT_626300 [Lasiosphaeria ovina]|uniref:Uncharacterized protein n=1 Tax=Lasiosphaeria ovina TaxID=92902 RepID=A0AAE0KDT9_9PEZI|nr:hypothetical protein B0T24DRAFT_626300 [Lasiosphaeria ovina]